MDPYLHDVIVLTEMFMAVTVSLVLLYLMASYVDEQ